MAVTIPTTSEQTDLKEVKPALPIAIGNRDELRDLNRQMTRVFTDGVNVNRLICSAQRLPFGMPLTAGFTTITRSKIRVWDDVASFKTRCQGRYFNVKITIGGIALPTLVGTGSVAWYSAPTPTKITGATIDADGFADVLVEALYTNSLLYRLNHIALEETQVLLADLPAPSSPTIPEDFFPLDDGPFVAGEPVDHWLLQTLDDNSQRVRDIRARGMATCYPTGVRPHLLSSVHWRFAGPYMVAAPPWATRATVQVTAALEAGTTDEVELFVLSEVEQFQAQLAARSVTISSTTAASWKFDDIKLTSVSGNYKTNLIWIAFRSVLGATRALTVYIGDHHGGTPWRLYCHADLSAEIPWPSGLAAVGGVDGGAFQYKTSFSFGQPAAYFDIANVEGEDTGVVAGSNIRQAVLMSPHPGTGITVEPQLAPTTWGGAVNFQASFDVYDLGIAELYGVYIEVRGPAVERRKLAWAGSPPSAGLVQLVAGDMNATVRYLTPMLLTQHPGNRNIKDEAGAGIPYVYPEGHYFFLPNDGAGAGTPFDIEVPISADPNIGAVGGLLIDKIYAQACYMIGAIVLTSNEIDGKIEWTLGAGDTLTSFSPIHPRGGYENDSPTIADATLAATAASEDPASPSPPVYTYENDYSQQYTWPSDGWHTTSPWLLSPIVSDDMPVAFPAIVNLRIRNFGGVDANLALKNHSSVIVAGLHVWCGPRL